MFHLLYNCFVVGYALIIRYISPFHPKAKRWINGRKGAFNRLKKHRAANENWIWFHCSSLGEYEDCCEIIHDIGKRMPDHKLLLTFFSPSGYEALKGSPGFHHVMYLPVDRKVNVITFLDILQPSLVLFGRSELWLNYLFELKNRSIPLFLISLKMDETSGFLKRPAAGLYKRGFHCFSHIYCQDEKTRDILHDRFGIEPSTVIGNTRFERIYKMSQHSIDFPEIARFTANDFTVIAGSYLPRELELIHAIMPSFLELNCKLILVPHEINKSAIARFQEDFPTVSLTYSAIDSLNDQHRILIVDHVGSLKYLYKYADLAIIGGGFNRIGIHNIIEPAVYGLVTLFGPNHRNYQEAIDLIELKFAKVFHDAPELLRLINEKLNSSVSDDRQREHIQQYVKDHVPDSSRISRDILEKFRLLVGETE